MCEFAFELIKVAIGRQEQLSRVPTAQEWEGLFDFAVKQTLVGIMYSGIERLPKAQRPSKQLLINWYFTVDEVKRRNALMNKLTGWVTTNFRNDGYEAVILKGQGIAQLYPNPELRVSGDIDVWVLANRDRLINYLKQNGVKGRIVYHNMAFTVFNNVEVEMHFTPSWMNNYFTNIKLQRFFKNCFAEQTQHCVRLADSKTDVCVPTVAFNRVFILQHIYRHLFGSGIGLRQIIDYYYVLQQPCSDAERADTLSMLRELHMLKFTAAVMYVMMRVLGLEREKMIVQPDEHEGQFLLDEIMKAGNFGHYDERIQIPENENKLHSFFRITKQNMRLLFHYPEETLWNPLYRAWHYVWRLSKGYKIE